MNTKNSTITIYVLVYSNSNNVIFVINYFDNTIEHIEVRVNGYNGKI